MDEDKIIRRSVLRVMHLSEHVYGAGLLRVYTDLIQLLESCIYSNSKLKSRIRPCFAHTKKEG